MSENDAQETGYGWFKAGAITGLVLFFIAAFSIWSDVFYFPVPQFGAEGPDDDVTIPIKDGNGEDTEDKMNGWFIAIITAVVTGTIGQFVGGFFSELGKYVAEKFRDWVVARRARKKLDSGETDQKEGKSKSDDDEENGSTAEK